MTEFTAACVQLTASDVMEDNIAQAHALMHEAVSRGAKLIALPENAFYMRREGTHRGETFKMHAHPGVQFVQDFAKEHACHVVIGSVRAPSEVEGKFFNRCVAVNHHGDIAAHYDKIHLFDATTPCGQEYRESSQFVAGDKLVTAPLDGCGTQGLSVCYDLRFAHLYRELALRGAEVLHVPAAFTRPTGKAHWSVLLRARAIECGAFVIAAAQCGEHPAGRTTYGHSMIIDPWGTVLAEAGEEPCVITATINLSEVARTRAQLPSLQHGREFS
jgi:predicted amidohydrolase